MRLPKNAGDFDVTPMHLRSPTALLAQYQAIAPSVTRTNGLRANGDAGARRSSHKELKLPEKLKMHGCVP